MTTIDILLLLLSLIVGIPIVVYYAVKFGTYANLRARDLYRQQHPPAGLKIHDEEK